MIDVSSLTHADAARLAHADAATVREAARMHRWTGPTAGLANGFAQANLIALPPALAYDFLLFAVRNPKPLPLLDVTDAGDAVPRRAAPTADLRTDLPRYWVFEQGRRVAEVEDATPYWRDDLVAFLTGCSFTFEWALLAAGVPLRHVDCGTNVAMYRTARPCAEAGVFRGPLVVSMRPIPQELVSVAVQASGRYWGAHGAPVHIGDPAALGIADLSRPDYGDPPVIGPGETPVFWACGVTAQAYAITHAPGHMFITDLHDASLALT
jgi:uncharacterized protein YcsI (UPF0317 family)